jgi:hypothetical protein
VSILCIGRSDNEVYWAVILTNLVMGLRTQAKLLSVPM